MASNTELKFIFFGLIIAGVILESIGDILFKKWTLENKNSLFILGLLLYFIGSLFWLLSLKYEFLSKAGSVFMILNLIVVVLGGVLIFKEDLTDWNKIGILLGIVSIILIET